MLLRTLFLIVGMLSICVVQASSIKSDPLLGKVLVVTSEDGLDAEVRVDAIELDDNEGNADVFLYTLTMFDEQKSEWQNICLPGPDGHAKAIIMQGVWDSSGHFTESDSLTFACTSGVLAKCVRWGYKPWLDSPELPMKQLHHACTRMARADYCGNGEHHTKDGTAINVFDVFGIQKRDHVDGMVFEAAWNTSGALGLNHGRYTSADNIIAECPSKLSKATFEHQSNPDIKALTQAYPDALIFNESFVLSD